MKKVNLDVMSKVRCEVFDEGRSRRRHPPPAAHVAPADRAATTRIRKSTAPTHTFRYQWVTERLTEMLGFEDEIVISLVINSMSDKVRRHQGTCGHLLHQYPTTTATTATTTGPEPEAAPDRYHGLP